jgi:hypothetical protein
MSTPEDTVLKYVLYFRGQPRFVRPSEREKYVHWISLISGMSVDYVQQIWDLYEIFG